jgi:hypothetical protein
VIAELGSSNAVLVANDVAEWQLEVSALAAVDAQLKNLAIRAYDDPALAAEQFDHYVLVEPPPAPAFAAFGDAKVTIAWNASSMRLVSSREADLLIDRPHMVSAFRAVKENGEGSLDQLLATLQEATPSPRIAARAVRALEELSIVRVVRSGDSVEAISALAITPNGAKTELDLSPTFRSYSADREETKRWLRQLTEEQIPERPSTKT